MSFVLDKPSRYKGLRGWIFDGPGKGGLARLNALGAAWRRGATTVEVVEGIERLPGAPALPPLWTFRDKAAFLAGAAWVLVLIANRSKSTHGG